MADEQQEPTPAPKASSSLVKSLIILGIVILVPAILGLVTFQFVLRPMLGKDSTTQTEFEYDVIPPTAVTLEFQEDQVSVLTDDPNVSSPLLIYQIAMVCKNAQTASLIQDRLPHFRAKILQLHRNRMRSELNDPYMQDTLLRQSRQEANILLRQFDPHGSQEVLDVMYTKFTIFDL